MYVVKVPKVSTQVRPGSTSIATGEAFTCGNTRSTSPRLRVPGLTYGDTCDTRPYLWEPGLTVRPGTHSRVVSCHDGVIEFELNDVLSYLHVNKVWLLFIGVGRGDDKRRCTPGLEYQANLLCLWVPADPAFTHITRKNAEEYVISRRKKNLELVWRGA